MFTAKPKLAKECTQFKPSLALTVLQLLRAKRVLDFSAGWGDRLLGAIAHSELERYLVSDEEKETQSQMRSLENIHIYEHSPLSATSRSDRAAFMLTDAFVVFFTFSGF